MAFDIKGILVGAAVGSLAGKAMGDSWGRGAAVGAIVALAGPMVANMLPSFGGGAAPAAPAAAK